MKESYEVILRCAICGSEDHFEFNEDKSYIKCTFCNREYLGGIDELRELNQEVLDERMKDIRNDVATHIKDALSKAFSGNKNIKLK